MALYLPFYWQSAELQTLRGGIMFLLTLILGYHHLWYLAGLLFGGLLLYLARRWSTLAIAVAAAALLGAAVVLQYYRAYADVSSSLAGKIIALNWTSRNGLFIALPFLAIGYLLAKHKVGMDRYGSTVWAAIVIGLASLLFESQYNFQHLRVDAPGFDVLLSLSLLCPALLVLALSSAKSIATGAATKVSSAVYFCHPLFISLAHYSIEANWFAMTTLVSILSLLAAALLIRASARVSFVL